MEGSSNRVQPAPEQWTEQKQFYMFIFAQKGCVDLRSGEIHDSIRFTAEIGHVSRIYLLALCASLSATVLYFHCVHHIMPR